MSSLTFDDIRAELERAGMVAAPLNGDGPLGWESVCPCCGHGGVIRWREGDTAWTCANGCDPSRIAAAIYMRGAKSWNERSGKDAVAFDEARRQLEQMWGLANVGVSIVGARIVGRGSRASADIYLDNGDEIVFDSLRDAARPSTLLPELAASVGATPGIKQQQALQALTLLRRIATHQVTFTEDEIARDWGVSYLQAAETLDVDINDQAERWGAFSRLHRTEGRLILRHTDGSRYVRAGWFYESIRGRDAAISPHELAHRMERVGWGRRGNTGRIKATAPGRTETLAWSFYIVPAGWENEA